MLRVPGVITRAIALRMTLISESRAPDKVIGGDDAYLKRWYLIPRNRFLNAYLHVFLRDDDDRAHHDHPWASLSLMLDGRLFEHVTGGADRFVSPGDLVFRRASHAHRLEVRSERPAMTLFITGPRVREWGFHCPQGWRHWRLFTAPHDSGQIGRGCE